MNRVIATEEVESGPCEHLIEVVTEEAIAAVGVTAHEPFKESVDVATDEMLKQMAKEFVENLMERCVCACMHVCMCVCVWPVLYRPSLNRNCCSISHMCLFIAALFSL